MCIRGKLHVTFDWPETRQTEVKFIWPLISTSNLAAIIFSPGGFFVWFPGYSSRGIGILSGNSATALQCMFWLMTPTLNFSCTMKYEENVDLRNKTLAFVYGSFKCGNVILLPR